MGKIQARERSENTKEKKMKDLYIHTYREKQKSMNLYIRAKD
jgi:hypothetical protein